ncbi:MAG: hypothetical protein JW751_16700 [Polyangiaceae bacterium]|nr:hypothetical protein [Polyangiaceae bacterium]
MDIRARDRRSTAHFLPTIILTAALTPALLPACRCERAEDHESLPGPPASSSATPTGPTIPLLATVRDLRSRGKAEYRAPTEDEAKEYRVWVGAIAKAAWTDRLPTHPAPEGFSGRLGNAGALWLLQEQPTRKRGAGVVVIRPSRGTSVLVEAPHTFFDEGTLEIALSIFHGIGARGLLANTMHRYVTVPETLRGDKDEVRNAVSDLAHEDRTYFSAAHRSLLGVEALTTLQIHGFADATAPGVMAVVSAARTTGDALAVARALRDALGDDVVRVYPDEIDVLGGTTNVQAKASRELGLPFIHVELSRSLRDSVREDPALAARLVEAFRTLEGAAR